jgi:hypothetical protein
MDWITIEDRWPQYVAAAKRQWAKLSVEQITGTRGRRLFLLKRVQEAYGLTSHDAERQIHAWQELQVERPR